MSENEARLRKKTQREERLRKKTLRLRHQQFIQEDAARQLSSRENDRLVKEKATEQKLWDAEVNAQHKKDKARQEVVYVYSDEDSEEDSEEDVYSDDEDLDTSEDTDCNTCLSLSCLVVLFLVSNLLIMQFVLTRQE
jgi:hypothetical protein